MRLPSQKQSPRQGNAENLPNPPPISQALVFFIFCKYKPSPSAYNFGLSNITVVFLLLGITLCSSLRNLNATEYADAV